MSSERNYRHRIAPVGRVTGLRHERNNDDDSTLQGCIAYLEGFSPKLNHMLFDLAESRLGELRNTSPAYICRLVRRYRFYSKPKKKPLSYSQHMPRSQSRLLGAFNHSCFAGFVTPESSLTLSSMDNYQGWGLVSHCCRRPSPSFRLIDAL